MSRDDDIDDQVDADREFTRRAEQLMTKLRNQGIVGGASPQDAKQKEDETPTDNDTPKPE